MKKKKKKKKEEKEEEGRKTNSGISKEKKSWDMIKLDKSENDKVLDNKELGGMKC